MTAPRILLAAALLLGTLAAPAVDAGAPQVTTLDLELDGPGVNVDDPCFWVDANDPAESRVFVTTKDSGLVEAFDATTGTLLATIPGFERPNNCAVEGDLLLTTDRGPLSPGVKVHHLPDLTPVFGFAGDMTDPHGVDLFHTSTGQTLVYVTDGATAMVHVYDLGSGTLVDVFDSTFNPGIEPVVTDDVYERIFVSREEPRGRGIGLFTPEGSLVREFAAPVFANDTEGLALYRCGAGGYLVAADQGLTETEFEVFDRVTLGHIGTFRLRDQTGDATNATDGIDILQTPLPGFPNGVLAACDGCGSSLPDEMDVVSWDRIAEVMALDLCPGGEEPDCSTVPCVERIPASADTWVTISSPNANNGTAPGFEIDADPLANALLRFEVPDLTGFDLLKARIRLTVDAASGSDADVGGVLFVTAGAWNETTVTWNTRPTPVGLRIGSVGAVTTSQAVDFDVSGTVVGPAVYDFAILTSSTNRVRYRSREAGESPPALLLSLHASSPPEIAVVEPTDGVIVPPGEAVTLAAVAEDPEGRPLSAIAWWSDRDFALGAGSSLTTTLTPGRHTITARVVDAAGLGASATVHVLVTTPPAVTITAPLDGASAFAGTPVTLAGTALDAEDGDLGARLTWASDRDGALGTGASRTATFSMGTHRLTASVTDSAGATGSASVTVEIRPRPTTTTTSTSTSTSSSRTTSSSTSTSRTTTSTSRTTSSSTSTSRTTTSTSRTTTSSSSTSTSRTTTSTSRTTTSSSSTSTTRTSTSSTSSSTSTTGPTGSTTTSTTSPSPSTSSTSTTVPPSTTSTSVPPGSTTSTSVPPPTTTSTIPPIDPCGSCDDGDRCTVDRCDPARGCLHDEPPATDPAAVRCRADSVRALVAVSPRRLTRGLEKVDRLIGRAESAAGFRRCRRALQAATRTARALAPVLAHLPADHLVAGASPEHLAREGLRLRERAAGLAAGYCTPPSR